MSRYKTDVSCVNDRIKLVCILERKSEIGKRQPGKTKFSIQMLYPYKWHCDYKMYFCPKSSDTLCF